MSRQLTTLQAAYVKHYAITGNRFQAVIAAGYSPKGASNMARQLKHMPHVVEALEKIQEKVDERIAVTVADIMGRLWTEAGDEENSGGERIAALRALQRMVPGALIPVQVESKVTVGGLSAELLDTIKQDVLQLH